VIGYHRVVDEIVDDGPLSPSLCIHHRQLPPPDGAGAAAFQVLTLEHALAAIDGVSPSSATPAHHFR